MDLHDEINDINGLIERFSKGWCITKLFIPPLRRVCASRLCVFFIYNLTPSPNNISFLGTLFSKGYAFKKFLQVTVSPNCLFRLERHQSKFKYYLYIPKFLISVKPEVE